MHYTDELPFPRGQTATMGITTDAMGATVLASGYRADLKGRIVRVKDTINGTNRNVFLRCMQKITSGDITVPVPTVGSKCVALDQTTPVQMDWATVAGFTVGSGYPAKPLDDAYVCGPNNEKVMGTGTAAFLTTISLWDWFYVVEEGPVWMGAGGQVEINKAVMSQTDGTVIDATTGLYVVGMNMSAQAAQNAVFLMYAKAGLCSPY